jgi:hypothetical protein
MSVPEEDDVPADSIALALVEYQVKELQKDVTVIQEQVSALPALIERKLEEHSERTAAKRRWSVERVLQAAGIATAIAIALWKH